jgi:hypothetical protein
VDSSKDNAMKLLDGSLGQLESMEASFNECFPYPTLSVASAEFSRSDIAASNDKVSKAVTTTLDSIFTVSQNVKTLETFLRLHIPKMEDGNNFGVSVQLSLLKELSDVEEAASKHVDDLFGYASARADALDKLKLPTSSVSITKSTGASTTDGKKEEKTSEATEEKENTDACTGPAYASRVAALVAIDTLYYSKAQRAFQAVLTLYMAALDFLDKNKDKLEKPKGAGGSHSGFASMY